ncbi:MAG: serine O-acetyltransferase [Geminicoccaceae bacterium]
MTVKHLVGSLTSDGLTRSVWQTLLLEARQCLQEEPLLAAELDASILTHDSLAAAVAALVVEHLELGSNRCGQMALMAQEAFNGNSANLQAASRDLVAYRDRDPACTDMLSPFLWFKGFHALQCHRFNHWLWLNNRRRLAFSLQSRLSRTFGLDIHPAACMGQGIVIGETAIIGDHVSLLHNVTLGGTGKASGDRHPKIERGVAIGAQATILGNIQIRAGAQIGAGSVVLEDVPPLATAVGARAYVRGFSAAAVKDAARDCRPTRRLFDGMIGTRPTVR